MICFSVFDMAVGGWRLAGLTTVRAKNHVKLLARGNEGCGLDPCYLHAVLPSMPSLRNHCLVFDAWSHVSQFRAAVR